MRPATSQGGTGTEGAPRVRSGEGKTAATEMGQRGDELSQAPAYGTVVAGVVAGVVDGLPDGVTVVDGDGVGVGVVVVGVGVAVGVVGVVVAELLLGAGVLAGVAVP
jgi:hypothetical protein